MYCKKGDLLQFCLNRRKNQMSNEYEVPFAFGFATHEARRHGDGIGITTNTEDYIERDFHRFNLVLPIDNTDRLFLPKRRLDDTDYKDRPFVETED